MEKKILLVDDQRRPEVIPSGSLDSVGLPTTYSSDDVEVVRDYFKAVEALKSKRWDVLLLDHDLACFRDDGREMNGYDVLCWLEEHPEHIPKGIKLVTANASAGKKMLAAIQKMVDNGQTKYLGWV